MSEYRELIIIIVVTALVFTFGGFFIGTATAGNSGSEQTQTSSSTTSADMEHDHGETPVPADTTAPTVKIELTEDEMSGYNLRLITENYKFTPGKIGSEPVANEGHAHLFINGNKVARLYSPWFHIPAEMLTAESNEITVTLNANDHSDWTVNDEHISASQLLEAEPESE